MGFFKPEEFGCKCGCGLNNPDPKLLSGLNIAREDYGNPITIESACRCVKHNKTVGGVTDSAHTPQSDGFCKATDLRVTNGQMRFNLLRSVLKAGFTRIGIGKNFIHVDVDMDKPQFVTWLYGPGGASG